MSSTSLFIDVSQFISYPVPTGVQRTLLYIARHWQADKVVAEVGFRQAQSLHYSVTPLEAFRDALDWTFKNKHHDGPAETARQLVERLVGQETSRVVSEAIPEKYQGYLLPEPTFRDDILDTVDLCKHRMKRNCIAIVYDALQQTHPEYFPGPHTGFTDRYFLTMVKLDSIAFISKRTHEIVESRFSRSKVPNSLEMPLGADAFGRERSQAPQSPRFVVVGTVEPRKRPRQILAAFERLWNDGREYELHFLGRPGWDAEDAHFFRRRARELSLFSWDEAVADEELASALRLAAGAIFVSELEGYGLPAVEALALGCPVIISEGLPSMDTLPGAGQLRLAPVSEETIAAAVERLADPSENAVLREAITTLDLPEWRQVIQNFETWIGDTLDNDAAGWPA